MASALPGSHDPGAGVPVPRAFFGLFGGFGWGALGLPSVRFFRVFWRLRAVCGFAKEGLGFRVWGPRGLRAQMVGGGWGRRLLSFC